MGTRCINLKHMNKYKVGEKAMFTWYADQIINCVILDVIEHKHLFSKPTYSYNLKYNVRNMEGKIIEYKIERNVTEDKIYKPDLINS